MPFSAFDDQTRRLLTQALDGALLVLSASKSVAVTDDRRAETIALLTSRLVRAAADGDRDYLSLQSKVLEGID
jgi:hypothetical protein